MREAIAPQSDLAVFNMLGYNFKDKGYVGKGVIESISSNIDFRDGGLAVVLANIVDNLAYQHGLHFLTEVYPYRNHN